MASATHLRRFLISTLLMISVVGTISLSFHRDAETQASGGPGTPGGGGGGGGTPHDPQLSYTCQSGVNICQDCDFPDPGQLPTYAAWSSPGTGYQVGGCQSEALQSPIPSCRSVTGVGCGDVFRCSTNAFVGVSIQSNDWCKTTYN